MAGKLAHGIWPALCTAFDDSGQTLDTERTRGLVRSLLEMGARNVIASHWAVADQSTALWVDELYKQYLAGASVSRAVRLAARKVREDHPSVYHWGAFSAFGCG